MDIVDFNARWLAAWSAKDTTALLAFYSPGTTYKDPQVPGGITGHAALKAYLDGLFAATPPMTYAPDEVWPIAGGYCGRWICTIEVPNAGSRRMRGFDLVLLEGERISFNEVYTHNLPD